MNVAGVIVVVAVVPVVVVGVGVAVVVVLEIDVVVVVVATVDEHWDVSLRVPWAPRQTHARACKHARLAGAF